MSWECSLAGRALAVVHEALGSVPSAGITAAAAAAKTTHAPQRHGSLVSAAAHSEVGLLLSADTDRIPRVTQQAYCSTVFVTTLGETANPVTAASELTSEEMTLFCLNKDSPWFPTF